VAAHRRDAGGRASPVRCGVARERRCVTGPLLGARVGSPRSQGCTDGNVMLVGSAALPTTAVLRPVIAGRSAAQPGA
jgi:hypothetical protein